jgi:hypothetical protein
MFFRVGATFEMRTVLYKISLFNDQVEVHDWVFISKKIMQGESKTRERDREREREREHGRQSIAGNER